MWRFICVIISLSLSYSANSQCSADFTYEKNLDTFHFVNLSQIAEDDTLITQVWNFDDGNTSTQENPSHVFNELGLFNVSLQFNTTKGCNVKDSVQIEVCEIELDYVLNTICDDGGNISLFLYINDLSKELEYINVKVDNINITDTLIPINGEQEIILKIPGDGNEHSVYVESTPNGFCSETISFFVEDCNTDCFLSNFKIDDGHQATHEIQVQESGFFPNNKEIFLGDRIRFIWQSNNHSTKSVDSISIDKWDSGLQDIDYVYDLVLKNSDIKPFYSEGPNDTEPNWSGNIIAKCPSAKGNTLGLSFNNSALSADGFHVGVDGVILKDTIYQYSESGFTEIEFVLTGDGKQHQITIHDIADPTCTLLGNTRAINCFQEFDCAINVQAQIIERCNADSIVQVEISVGSLSPSEEGILIMVDDTLVMDTIYFDGGSAATTIPLYGDGFSHKVEAIDLRDTTCRDITSVRVNDCSLPCGIENLEIGTGSNNTFVLAINNTKLSLEEVAISSGDKILWQWVQDSLVGVRSLLPSGPDSWDSGLMENGGVFTSPALTAGIHPYYLYNRNGTVLVSGSIEVVAACEDNMIPIFYNFTDINGSPQGYDIYVDNIRREEGPFAYKLDGMNRGFFKIEGDDQQHEIEIRDIGEESCVNSAPFIAPSCEKFPCGATMDISILDSCFNNNTVRYKLTVDHPEPTAEGFVVSLNGNLLDGFPFQYGPGGVSYLEGTLFADSSLYEFTFSDLKELECVDTLRYQSYRCITDCRMDFLSIELMDEAYASNHPTTPDSLIGCRDSMIYAEVRFAETYSDSESYRIMVDGILQDETYYYNDGDTINSVFIRLMGDSAIHTIQVLDSLDQNCRISANIFTPRCFSLCHIGIEDIVIDSCANKTGFYSVQMDTMTNSIGYHAFYDGKSIDVSKDSLMVMFQENGDGLTHELRIVDDREPACRDSIIFTGAYCLDCPIDVTYIQKDSCEIGDSIGYDIIFGKQLDSLELFITYMDSTWKYKPIDNDFRYFIRVRGDNGKHTIHFQSTIDQFCTASLTIETIDCTPIICEPNFTYTIDGLTITMTDSSYTSEPITSQSWNINDVIDINNLSTFNYTVDSIGTYKICHKIITDSCTSIVCEYVKIGDPCTLISPSFEVSQVQEGFQFKNTSIGDIDSYLYSFGDGIFSNSENPFHLYDVSGTYNACLTVRQDKYNCILEYCDSIMVIITHTKDIEHNSFIIYPNPLLSDNRTLYVRFDQATRIEEEQIKLIDISGRNVPISIDRMNDAEIKADLGGVTNGLYTLSLYIDNGWISKKIVVGR